MALSVAALTMGNTLIKKIFPDPADQTKAQLAMMEAEQSGDLKELEIQMSAIVMEAKSSDPWTSRARPAFLYVMYIMILTSIPMGVLFIFYPENAKSMISGVQLWLAAIPTEMWALFGTGYLGYVNKRSEDKRTTLGKDSNPGLISRILG